MLLLRSITYGMRVNNITRWVLRENTSTRRGIPTFLQTATLLKRSSNTNFITTVDIQAGVDLAHTMSTSFRNIASLVPRDEPILFRVDNNSCIDSTLLDDLGHLDYVDLRGYINVPLTKLSR
jgi:hypothetical protein